MKVEIVATSLLPRHAAARLASLLREAVDERGTASLALSGGRGVPPLFRALADIRLPWEHIHVFQVDERVAPDGHTERNWNSVRADLLGRLPQQPAGVHPMPVAAALDGGAAALGAAERYLEVLEEVTGCPITLDVVHLGLGEDGHTASLVPGDPVLTVADRDVALAEAYGGRRRMTLTYPALARARHLVWFVTGGSKVRAVQQLVRADASVPAGRVAQQRAQLLVDPDAAAALR